MCPEPIVSREVRSHLVVPAVETELMQVRRAVDGIVALLAVIVWPKRLAVWVLEPLVLVDENAHLLVAHACARKDCTHQAIRVKRG